MDDNDDHKPPEAFSQLFDKLCQSVPENSKQAFAADLAKEAMKLAKSHGVEPRSVVESSSVSSTAIVMSSGAVAYTNQTSGELLVGGKYMMRRHVILLR